MSTPMTPSKSLRPVSTSGDPPHKPVHDRPRAGPLARVRLRPAGGASLTPGPGDRCVAGGRGRARITSATRCPMTAGLANWVADAEGRLRRRSTEVARTRAPARRRTVAGRRAAGDEPGARRARRIQRAHTTPSAANPGCASCIRRVNLRQSAHNTVSSEDDAGTRHPGPPRLKASTRTPRPAS